MRPTPRGSTGTRSGCPPTAPAGEWLCSRVYAVLGRGEPALWHARRALAILEIGGEGIEDWDRPAVYEALARACAVAGDPVEAGGLAGPLPGRAGRRGRRRGSGAHRRRPGDAAPRLREEARSPAAIASRVDTSPSSRSPPRYPRVRSQARDPALEPGRDVAGDARRRPPGGSTRLRPSLDVGPPLRDLRRPVPADLRGLDLAGRLGDGHRADAARAPGRGEHPAQPGAGGQDGGDPRPHQRRPGDPRSRRRLVRPGAPGPRDRIRVGLRPAPRLARRVGRRGPDPPRRRDRDLGARRALRVRRPSSPPDADPGPAPDHDRRERREEDPPDGGPLRRHVERDGAGRLPGPQGGRPRRALRRGRPGHLGDRVHPRHQGHDPGHARPRRPGSSRRRWRRTARR